MDSNPPYDQTIFPELETSFPGFWHRFGAAMIDGLITSAFALPLTYINVSVWKSPYIFVIVTLITACYKPFFEYRFAATIGKMALGICVVGDDFQKVGLKAELRRVSFYVIPAIIQMILTLPFYFMDDFQFITSYSEYGQLIATNKMVLWIDTIVIVLLILDCIFFYSDKRNRSLHDMYAKTYVVFKSRSYLS